MTSRALLGLGALNLAYLVVGVTLAYAVRGFSSWGEAARLAGVAYLCGVALLGSLLTFELFAGVSLSIASVITTAALASAAAVATGHRMRRKRPRLGRPGTAPVVGVAGTVGLAALVVFLEALFRAGRLSGLFAWDAWSFWVPKAKAIYYFGGLDEQLFATLPGPSYPPLLPVLDAAAFHFMGSPDVVTLHVQFWTFAAGFALAVAALLSESVPAWLFWPFLLLALMVPRANEHLLTPQADFLMDFLFALAALLILCWLRDDARWQLALASVLLTGSVLLKREGLLLAVCLVAATILATLRRRRTWLALAAAALPVAIAVGVWRLWLTVVVDPGGFAAVGGVDLGFKPERIWPSLRLAIEVFFDADRWTVLGPLFVAAIVLAALARFSASVVFAGALLLFVTLGGAGITWAIPGLPITDAEAVNPIVRYTAAAVLVGAVVTPVLLADAWRGTRAQVGQMRFSYAAAVVGGVILAYPVAVLAGGLPRFPSQADCTRPAVVGSPVDLVFGSFDRPGPAAVLEQRARRLGYVQIRTLADGCGRWEVAVTGYESLEGARDAQAEAARVGLTTRLERPAP